MLDLRYHIVSLIAVFLALAGGFVMGAALTGPEKQAGALAQLRQDMDELRQHDIQIKAENSRMQRRLTAWEREGRALGLPAIRGRLGRDHVAVIVCGASTMPKYWPDLEAALAESGATVGPLVLVPDELKPPDRELERLSQVWEDGREPPSTGKYRYVSWMVRGIAAGGQARRIDDLARATGMRVERSSAHPVRHILVLLTPRAVEGTQAASPDGLPEQSVVDAAGSAGVRAVLAEEDRVEPSLVAQFAGRGIPTVDNIDSTLGQMAAVLALSGADGAFGTKHTGARALPPLEP